MTTSDRNPGERILDVHVNDTSLTVNLADGRVLSVPLGWFPRLVKATPEARSNWELAGGGFGIHWPDVDEDLSSAGLLKGARAPSHDGAA